MTNGDKASVARALALAFWAAAIAGAFFAARWGWRKWQAHKAAREEGALRLPLTGGEDDASIVGQ